MTQTCGFRDSDSSLASIYPIIKLSVNSLGLSCALIVVFAVVLFLIFSPKLIDRVTLRLQAGISLIDVVRHIAFFFSCHNKAITCPFIGFLRILGDHIYFTLNFSIALNMQLIFLHKLHPQAHWEKWYWMCSLCFPLFIDLFFFYKGFFGETKSGVCLVRVSGIGITFRSIHITLSYLTTIYCLCVACLVIKKLKRKNESLDFMSHYLYKHNFVSREVVKARMVEIVLKSTYYPLACFFSLFFYNIYIIIEDIENVCSIIILLTMLGLAFTGVLNLLAFLVDPMFQKAYTTTQVIFMNRFGSLAKANVSEELASSRMVTEQDGAGVVEIYLDSSCLPYIDPIDNSPDSYNDEFVRGYLEFT